MQETPLLIASLLDFAETYHPDAEIVSRTVEGPIHRYGYADAARRSRQLVRALEALGVERGDRVATLAWNGYRHFELYFGVSGMGAVLHTINPRLFEDQIVYIANHAEDRVLFFDRSFLSLVEKIADRLTSVKALVVLTDEAHRPESSLPELRCYEELIADCDADYEWPELDEDTASSLCYTSGTTGNPKGVLYSHRSTVLHTFALCAADGMGIGADETVLPVVPMFHANAWGLVYATAMCGARLVLPGAGMDGASLYELYDQEKVTFTAGVPTVWHGLLEHLRANDLQLPHLTHCVVGGSAAPRSMIEAFDRDYDVRVMHSWGMTEISPLGTVGRLKPKLRALPFERQLDYQAKQGRAIYGVDLQIVDDQGSALPRDGETFGHLMVRGPWIARRYFKDEGGEILDDQGWFDTNDVATLDPEGYMQITDRAKDVIKSGGEWISSIDVENIAVAHPDVVEAAVIGIPHEKWDERPLLVVIPREGADRDTIADAILEFIRPKVAKWWVPDAVALVDDIPHTATGKIKKIALRERFAEYRW